MRITVTIPTELELLVQKRAAAVGKTVESYALDLLKRDAELPDPWELFADVRTQIKAAGTSEEELETEVVAAIEEVRARHRRQK